MKPHDQQPSGTADKLVEATRRCLIEEGHAACTVKRIAARAGVNHGLVHHYFGSKDALLLEVLRREEAALREGLKVPPERFVRDFAMPEVVGHPERPRLFIEFLAMAKSSEAVAARLREIHGLRMEQMEALFGLRDRTDAALVFAAFFGLAMMQSVVPDLPAGDAARRMVNLLRAAQAGGAEPTPPTSGPDDDEEQ